MDYKEFASYVKEKRIEARINQKDMALLIPMKAPKYNKIENGKQEPSFFELQRICQILNIDLNIICSNIPTTNVQLYD